MFKNKAVTSQNNPQGKNNGFNVVYAMGLAKALGLNLKKDAFSEQNMKSRDHLGSIKEKLAFSVYKKIHEKQKRTADKTWFTIRFPGSFRCFSTKWISKFAANVLKEESLVTITCRFVRNI